MRPLSKTATHLAILAGRLLVGFIVFVVVAAALASAQDPVPVPPSSKAIPADHVPSWVLYWAAVGALLIGGVLTKAITFLWNKLTAVQDSSATALQKLNEKLQEVQTAHTVAVERLKQESADFGREAVSQLAVSTEAIEDLTAVTNQLLAELHKK